MRQTKIEKHRFCSAREFIDFTYKYERIWVHIDQPDLCLLRMVDENLEFVIEITLTDYLNTHDALSVDEKSAMHGASREVEGCCWKYSNATEHQEFLLSMKHWKAMAGYLQRKFRKEIESSRLRTFAEATVLKKGQLPLYDIYPDRSVYFFDDMGQNIEKLKGKPRVSLPIFEVGHNSFKEYNSIWEADLHDFSNNSEMVNKENKIYDRIVEEIGKDVIILMPISTSLTVLPCTNWAEGKAGFSIFENIGIGVYKK